jgi:hypothetical protein
LRGRARTHVAEERVHEGEGLLDLRALLLHLGAGGKHKVELTVTRLEGVKANVERPALGDTVETARDTAAGDLLDLLGRFFAFVIVDNLVSAVLLDEVKGVRGGGGDDLVAHGLGELEGEQTDRGGASVDKELRGSASVLVK